MNLNEPITAQRVSQSVGKYRWTICALLFFATTVNYLDRQVLSLLAPDLSRQFGWSNTDYANIAAVFQFTYAISMLFAGRVVDKIGTKAAFVVAICIWSTGAVMHAFAEPMGEGIAAICSALGIAVIPVSIAGFMLSRAVLAIGESANFPTAIKVTAEYFPKKERSFATGIFNSGANVGAILAPISVPLIAGLWGWQTAFIVIGMLGFIWMGVWLVLYDKPEQQKRLSAQELAHIRSDSPASARGADGRRQKGFVVPIVEIPSDLGVRFRQVHDRWCVVVLSLLASDLPVGAVRPQRRSHRGATGRAVQHDHGRQYRRRLVPQLFHGTWRQAV
ncbi:UNVERIFIED_ORG: MFS family permease [Pseudomonas reinekei]|nr:MFS family permease [Pseudomonas reinekei]